MNCTSIIAAVVLLQGFAATAASLPSSGGETNTPPPAAPATLAAPVAPAPSAASALTLESFHIIQDRNIFNPNRSGRSQEREYTRREERRARLESFALVGTLSYEKGFFAFFDGTSSDYRRVLKASDTIAGFTVAAVSPQQVTLQSTNSGDYALPVGMQLQRLDEGKWEVAPRPQTASGDRSSSSLASNRFSSSNSGGGGSEEVMKRLMQQREQEGAVNPQPISETPPAQAKPISNSSAENDVVRRLMQRREQETDK
jgi:hypothetical protein